MNRTVYPALFALTICCFGCNKDDDDQKPDPAALLATSEGRAWNWTGFHIGNGPAPVHTCVSSATLWFYSDGEYRLRYPAVVTECPNQQGTWRFLSENVFVIQTATRADTFQLKELTENRLVFGQDSVFANSPFEPIFVQYTYFR